MEKITYASLGSLGDSFHQSFEAAWSSLESSTGNTFPLYINDQPVKTRHAHEVLAPFDTRVHVASFAMADPSHAKKAVLAAKDAFPAWRDTPWQERVRLLRKAASILTERQFHAAAVVCMETGKNRYESIAEVSEAIDLILYYCDQMEARNGLVIAMHDSSRERTHSLLKPYGVWAVIGPFNFPIALISGMAAAALVTGNTVVLKPASDTPWSAYLFYEALRDAGLPKGVANFITGPGGDMGLELSTNPNVDGMVFTGSKDVGMGLLKRFSQDYPKPCIAEMGGKNAAIIMPSAITVDAIEGVVRSAFGMAGQKCSACSRLYVHQDIYKPFLEALVDRASKLVLGPPYARDAFVSPLISALALKRYNTVLRSAKTHGRVLLGAPAGKLPPYLAHGHYAHPAIIDSLPSNSKLFQDEYFAPILAVAKVDSLNHAITLANQGSYGLTAGIFTQDAGEQKTFFDNIHAGVTYANRRGGATTGAWPGVQSFGGWRASGSSGKNALGPYYIQQFTHEQSQTIST
jgi:1-pyrroline-5-carboxylate dehydrogenase